MRDWLPPALKRSSFAKGLIGAAKFPLRKIPIRSSGAEMLVLGRNDYDAPAPRHLGEPGHEAELYEVLRVRDDVVKGIWPTWFLHDHDIQGTPAEPFLGFNPFIVVDVEMPESAANIVHMDNPSDLGKLLRAWLLSNGGEHPAVDNTGNGIFLDLIPKCDAKLAKAVSEALWEAAQTKQFFGRARPEEIVGYNCTHYPEGCPKHPAYPAGHGAAAGATFAVIESEFNLEKGTELWQTCLTASLQFAYFRTFAGVHFADDNGIGFLIGYAKTAGLKTVREASETLGWGLEYVA